MDPTTWKTSRGELYSVIAENILSISDFAENRSTETLNPFEETADESPSIGYGE